MKKYIYYLISIIIFIIPLYLMIGIWGIFEINKNSKNLFKTKENLSFHKKYSSQLHHIRDSDYLLRNENRKTRDYLFSFIHKDQDFKDTLLIQGDSWVEQISQSKSSEKLLKKFSTKEKINSINAGVTSFAPSAMHIQYKILKKDFQIKPNFLIIYIDQTDLGDEVCRYSKKKTYSSLGKLDFIEREKYTRAYYDYTKIYDYSELYLLDSYVKTIIKFPYIKIRYFFTRNLNEVKDILSEGWTNRNISKCSFREIKKELVDYNSNSKKIFKNSLNEYLDYLSEEKKLKKILIVSFPHKNHLLKSYNVNVSNYIDEVLEKSNDNRLLHLNISNVTFSNKEIKNMYIEGDIASHLKDEYHSKLFLKNILDKIKN